MAAPQTIAEVLARLASGSDSGSGSGPATRRHLKPSPLSAEALAAARADGLPSELCDWAAFHAGWLTLDEAGRVKVEPLREIMARWSDEMADESKDMVAEDSGPIEFTAVQMLEAWIETLPEAGLEEARAVELTYTPGSQEHLLILQGDRVRVLGCHKRLEFWWKYESLSELLAHWFELE